MAGQESAYLIRMLMHTHLCRYRARFDSRHAPLFRAGAQQGVRVPSWDLAEFILLPNHALMVHYHTACGALCYLRALDFSLASPSHCQAIAKQFSADLEPALAAFQQHMVLLYVGHSNFLRGQGKGKALPLGIKWKYWLETNIPFYLHI